MTGAEIARLLGRVQARWPHAKLDLDVADAWAEDLAGVPFDQAAAEVRAYALEGNRYAPGSAEIAARLIRRAQGEAPSFEDAVRLVAQRHRRALPYNPEGRYTPADTAAAIRALASLGVHEAVLRFVQQQGLRAVLFCPDGSMHPLDPNQQADRRDIARSYRDGAMVDWQRDPQPGLAAERAQRTLDADRRERRQLGPAGAVLDGPDEEAA